MIFSRTAYMLMLAGLIFSSTAAQQTSVTLTIGNGSGSPGTGGHAVAVALANSVAVRGVQLNLYDIPDNLDLTGCNTTSRTPGFTASFVDHGSYATIMLVSLSGGSIVSGSGSIVELVFSVHGTAPAQFDSVLQPQDVNIADQNNQPLTVNLAGGHFLGEAAPKFECKPQLISNTCIQGQNAQDQSLAVWNSGGGTLDYTITDKPAWLTCAPPGGSSAGTTITHAITYQTAALAIGDYNGTITLTGNASNSPLNLPVSLQIKPTPTSVTLSVGNGSGSPGSGGHAVAVALGNHVAVRGVQLNLYDIPDNLDVTACNTTSRTPGFTTSFVDHGAYTSILLVSLTGGSIAPGSAAIMEVVFSVHGTAPQQSNAILRPQDIHVADQANQPLLVNPVDGNFLVNETTPPAFSGIAATPSLAKLGAAVTISFTASEVLASSPTLTVNGHTATIASHSGPSYGFSYAIQSSDPDGPATIAISGSDPAGNPGSATNTTALKVDKTAPAFSGIAATPSLAKLGAAVTISFTASEVLASSPTLSVNGHAATLATHNRFNYSFAYLIRSDDPIGWAAIVVSGTDLAGNPGSISDKSALKIAPPNDPPVISEGRVIPATGDTLTSFSYQVKYFDPDGDGPTVAKLVIDESTHTLVLVANTPSSGTYAFSTKLPDGPNHSYFFTFDDGHNHAIRLPASGSFPGPLVNPRFQLTLSANPPGTGRIDPNPLPNPADQKYAAGTRVSLTAVPANGYAFSAWSGAAPGTATNPISITMDANKTQTASFVRVPNPPIFTLLEVNPAWACPNVSVVIRFAVNQALQGNPALSVNGREATLLNHAGLTYAFSYRVPDGETEGAAAIAIRGVNLAGDAGSLINTVSLFIDKRPPTITILNPSDGSNWTTNTLRIAGASADPGSAPSGIKRVQVRLQGAPWVTASGTQNWTAALTLNAPGTYQLEALAEDNAGNIASAKPIHVFHGLDSETGNVLRYLLGISADPAGCDTNKDGAVDAADLIYLQAPANPNGPKPADQATNVAVLTNLDWDDCPGAKQYDLYLWKSSAAQPLTPTGKNLATSFFDPPATLAANTRYSWQVIAKNDRHQVSGPIWTFTTKANP